VIDKKMNYKIEDITIDDYKKPKYINNKFMRVNDFQEHYNISYEKDYELETKDKYMMETNKLIWFKNHSESIFSVRKTNTINKKKVINEYKCN
jgi:hypothetical protein